MSNERTSERLPKIGVLYEDEDCAVIDKPAGLMVHSDGRNRGPFLADWILENYPEAKGVGEPMNGVDGQPLERSGIVHRLDRETSGVLLIAKTQKGFESLKKQFQDRTIHKTYLAFVWGELSEEFGTIAFPIGRSGNDFRKWTSGKSIRGDVREAETYWTKLGAAKSGDDKFSLLEVEPKTGRTHQIRVHLNFVNHPVVGDALYAPKRPMALGFDRLALHSRAIEFDGLDGKRVKVEAPLPQDFKAAAAILGLKL